MLARNQPQIGAQLPSIPEALRITHCGHQRSGGQRTHPRHRGQALAALIVLKLPGVTPFRWTVMGCGIKSLDDKFSRSQWATDSRWPSDGDAGYTILQ